jgi:hypothetical protein
MTVSMMPMMIADSIVVIYNMACSIVVVVVASLRPKCRLAVDSLGARCSVALAVALGGCRSKSCRRVETGGRKKCGGGALGRIEIAL